MRAVRAMERRREAARCAVRVLWNLTLARPLKVFETHIGFYDLVVAAPSKKAAAEAWGSSLRIFAKGFAKITRDSDAVRSALAHPGVVLQRPHGQAGAFKIEPDKPAAPKMNAARKKAAAKEAEAKARKAANERRARIEAEKRAKQQAKDELTAIEEEEARLRSRRQALQRKFHLRSI